MAPKISDNKPHNGGNGYVRWVSFIPVAISIVIAMGGISAFIVVQHDRKGSHSKAVNMDQFVEFKDGLKPILEPIKSDIRELRQDIRELKQDLKGLRKELKK
jgi:hypothetical protein